MAAWRERLSGFGRLGTAGRGTGDSAPEAEAGEPPSDAKATPEETDTFVETEDAAETAAPCSAEHADQTEQENWFRSVIETYPQPEYPVAQDWEISLAALVAKIPRIPRFAVRLLGLLDGMGALHIGRTEVGFDGSEVAWGKVTEIRTYSVSSLLSDQLVEEELQRVSRTLPPVPGKRWVVSRIGWMLVTAYAVVFPGAAASELPDEEADARGEQRPEESEHTDSADVAAEIVYRGWIRKGRVHKAGITSVLLLAAMPQTTEVILKTAADHGIPVVAATAQSKLGQASVRAGAIRGRIAGTWSRWTTGSDDDSLEAELAPAELEPASAEETGQMLASQHGRALDADEAPDQGGV